MTTHYPSWLLLLILLGLSCIAALPGAARRELAVKEAIRALEAESAGYSSRIRALNDAEDARVRGVQKDMAHD